jgi:hypothetical protein
MLAAEAYCAITAGRLSGMPFETERVWSYRESSGLTRSTDNPPWESLLVNGTVRLAGVMTGG